ncbi:MAG: hypothetical protein ACP5IO_05200 [Elusimicrobiales bacterium]
MIKDIYSNPCWIISGNEENFDYAIKYNLTWGLQDKWFPQWKAMEKGNIIFFYISGGIKKIIGCGKIENKFLQREPLWPDEIKENRVKYPLRFEFSLDYLIEKKEWLTKGIDIVNEIGKKLGQGAFADLLRGGINFIRYKEITEFLYDEFKKLNYTLPLEEISIEYKETKIERRNLHEDLENLVYEIGIMNKLLSQKEYSVDNMIFDVVWRRVEKGSPTYVFEIQVGGDIYHALSKLKHAFDLWNSNIFLIVYSNEDIYKSNQLLNGTFHEIKDKVKIVSSKDIEELFTRKRSWIAWEKKLGIL